MKGRSVLFLFCQILQKCQVVEMNDKKAHTLRYNNHMDFLLIVPFYTRWHYTRGMRDLVGNWMNVLYFLLEFFALEVVISTFGARWEVWQEHNNQNAIISFFGRLAHAIVQTVLLIVGFLSLIFTMIVGALLVIFWILFPFIVAYILALSILDFFA